MTDLRQAVSEGHYAKKQIHSCDRLIAWSHRRRFETAVELAKDFAGKCVLDFGCGDGTLLGLLMAERTAPALAVGVEKHVWAVEDCSRRFKGEPRLQFVLTSDLDGAEHRERYDAVFCMEVLEHVVALEPILQGLESLLTPGGALIVSVPVETGFPLIVKQTVRTIAGWRGIGDYPGTGSYTAREWLSSIFAGRRQHLTRPVFDTGDGPFHDHKGFNWMAVRDAIGRRFQIERCLASPLRSLGPHLASQVWFVAQRRSR